MDAYTLSIQLVELYIEREQCLNYFFVTKFWNLILKIQSSLIRQICSELKTRLVTVLTLMILIFEFIKNLDKRRRTKRKKKLVWTGWLNDNKKEEEEENRCQDRGGAFLDFNFLVKTRKLISKNIFFYLLFC